jgi:hypothetical protein
MNTKAAWQSRELRVAGKRSESFIGGCDCRRPAGTGERKFRHRTENRERRKAPEKNRPLRAAIVLGRPWRLEISISAETDFTFGAQRTAVSGIDPTPTAG